MGNFYVNYTLKGVSQQAVASAMAGRVALVSPVSQDVVVVFDKASDKQDTKIIIPLAAKLSNMLNCPVLAVLNHDDDILWYELYESGKLVDEYNSCPDYFTSRKSGARRGPTGGDPEKLCRAFGSDQVEEVELILTNSEPDEGGYHFEIQRHANLFEALGLPSFAVGGSYGYIDGGEIPDGLNSDDLIRTM